MFKPVALGCRWRQIGRRRPRYAGKPGHPQFQLWGTSHFGRHQSYQPRRRGKRQCYREDLAGGCDCHAGQTRSCHLGPMIGNGDACSAARIQSPASMGPLRGCKSIQSCIILRPPSPSSRGRSPPPLTVNIVAGDCVHAFGFFAGKVKIEVGKVNADVDQATPSGLSLL